MLGRLMKTEELRKEQLTDLTKEMLEKSVQEDIPEGSKYCVLMLVTPAYALSVLRKRSIP